MTQQKNSKILLRNPSLFVLFFVCLLFFLLFFFVVFFLWSQMPSAALYQMSRYVRDKYCKNFWEDAEGIQV